METPEEKIALQFDEQRCPRTDEGTSLTLPSSSNNAKRPTRQWAAWTRDEEESFFTALRQVGKNFEKITCRVQSKNKDQVRHYYYRLVRRMNKLLGPSLCLDAKDSKDTNAAMLRWWSLLEKYSCKPSKLHLKPRRYKIFVEALEHQLLKDRKKNVKKRLPQGENNSPSATAIPNHNKSFGNDAKAVKVNLVDIQNIQKQGQGKGSSTRKNSSIGVNRTNNKPESSSTKQTRQRRKTGVVSAAALKRWEKAAMAGVSLVADAAEHLERSSGGKEADPELAMSSVQAAEQNAGRLTGVEQTGLGHSKQIEDNMQKDPENIALAMKLKLQLFPIDERTRIALEMDKHNPHLELTLSARKKISSILEHLDHKWGSSSVASGELMLFPFSIHRDNFPKCQKWTRDSNVTAAEVYATIGSPPVFRLRYGWIYSNELQTVTSEALAADSSDCHVLKSGRKTTVLDQRLSPIMENEKSEVSENDIPSKHPTMGSHKSSHEQSIAAASGGATENVDDRQDNLSGFPDVSAIMLPKTNQVLDESTPRNTGLVVDQRVGDSQRLSDGEWADSLTNVSVGDLLNNAPEDMNTRVQNSSFGGSRCLQEIPFSCDSFDAAIAAHISDRNRMVSSGLMCASSIWDAEETCDAFSFKKRAASGVQVSSSSMATASPSGERVAGASLKGAGYKFQDVQEEAMVDDTIQDDPMECPSELLEDNSTKDFNNLTDIYWPDSLGPLELDVPPCKYYSEGLILSDSLSGLTRLIASSLDAFQNCSFFSFDDKGRSSPSGSQGGASFAGKVNSGDKSNVQSLQV